ncbi:hypothetical protein [Streptomyces sp. NPDC058625]|uniref:hypothetical protein n=1 Tax=Streptomyces sp. NPDC058625 TaxID=3346564 RepID=UPI0036610575
MPGDGLSDCTWPFDAFGKARKSEPTEADGRPAIALVVTDVEDRGGTYTFHVATEGKPYLPEVDRKGTDFRTTTTFSAFEEPLKVDDPHLGERGLPVVLVQQRTPDVPTEGTGKRSDASSRAAGAHPQQLDLSPPRSLS